MNVDLYAVNTKTSYKQAHLHVQEPWYCFYLGPSLLGPSFYKNVALPLIHAIFFI